MRVAYIMSRFPRLTETFVLAEILAMQADGVEVDLYPLLRERSELVQPEAARLVEAAHYQPFISGPILRSNLRMLRRKPRTYLGTLAAVVKATWRSPNFLFGGLAIFPKVVHNAVAMARTRVDHVHCHFANHPALAGMMVQRLVGIPYSFTAHGSDLHVDRRGLRDKVAGAAFVVAISEYNRRLIVEECGDDMAHKVTVIHCGVNTGRFRPRKTARREAGGPLHIVCVGTLHEVKGQRYLIEACRLLAQRGVQVACVLVGEGPDRDELERQIAAAELGDAVQLVGALTQNRLVEVLARADVLVTPSVPTASGKREGIPVVLMEAMSSGLPVVASDLSGIPELVVDGESGLLSPPGDPVALAQALERLVNEPELRHRLAEGGRRKVLDEFDVQANAAILAGRIATAGRAA